MLKSIAITLIGPDRPGLVNLVSDTAARHGANWLDSHLVNLGGQFAGIVHFHVPETELDTLIADFQGLSASGLQLSHAIGNLDSDTASATTGGTDPHPARMLMLEVTGPDHAGIVQGISERLATRNVSIDSFDSRSFSGSMSGEALFEAHARLRVPADLSDAALHDALADLSDALMIDIESA